MNLLKPGLIILSSFLFLLLVGLLPLPLPPYLDFQVLYHANMGLLRGISLYDHAGQVNMIAGLAHVRPQQVYVLPFPYPPWYALATLWLVRWPITGAVRLWFGLNLIMLFLSVWLLTDGWPPLKRLASFLFAVLFPPVLGSLVVGQYDFPVLLGAAWMVYALAHEQVAPVALAAVLLTFKPHLGVPIMLIVLPYLWLRKDRFGRQALVAIGIAGLVLLAAGFLASPLWPVDYFHSLTSFKDVSQCGQCVSLPMELAGLLHIGFDQAILFAAVLLVLMLGWLVWQWRRLEVESDTLMCAACLFPLFASPYLQNYDHMLLLIPLFVLAGHAHGFDWVWLAIAFLLPLAGLGLLSTRGDFTLLISMLILFALQAWRLRSSDKTAQVPVLGGS